MFVTVGKGMIGFWTSVFMCDLHLRTRVDTHKGNSRCLFPHCIWRLIATTASRHKSILNITINIKWHTLPIYLNTVFTL